MKRALSASILFLLPFFLIRAQSLFHKTIGGSGTDGPIAVLAMEDNGCVVLGETNSFSPDANVTLVRLGPAGSTQWAKMYGGSHDDRGRSLRRTHDGGFLVAGWSFMDDGYADVLLIRVDSSGSTQWVATFGAWNHDYGQWAEELPDGNILVTGQTMSYSGQWDCFAAKVSATGNLLWMKAYGIGTSAVGRIVQALPGDEILVVGWACTSSRNDVLLLKLSSTGNPAKAVTAGGFGDEDALGVDSFGDGRYWITGGTLSSGDGSGDAYIMEFTADLQITQAVAFGTSGWDRGFNVHMTRDSGMVVSGETSAFGYGRRDLFIVKLDKTINVKWCRVHQMGDTPLTPLNAAPAFDLATEGFFLTAPRYKSSLGNWDIDILKTDSLGHTTTRDSTLGFSIAALNFSSYVASVIDRARRNGTVPDTAVVVSFVSTDVNDQTSGLVREYTVDASVPAQMQLFHNFPNPVNPSTDIEFDVPRTAQVQLQIFDGIGRLVTTLVDSQLSPGRHRVRWLVSNLSTGVYYSCLRMDGTAMSRRMVVLK